MNKNVYAFLGFVADVLLVPFVPQWVWVFLLGFLLATTLFLNKDTLLSWFRTILKIPPPPDDKGYEVITYWGQTGDPLRDAINQVLSTKIPKTVYVKKTGDVKDLSHPSFEFHRSHKDK